jgi:hypothetical protein
MAGTCMIMYENVRYVMGGAQTVVGCTISTTFTWCDLHFVVSTHVHPRRQLSPHTHAHLINLTS